MTPNMRMGKYVFGSPQGSGMRKSTGNIGRHLGRRGSARSEATLVRWATHSSVPG